MHFAVLLQLLVLLALANGAPVVPQKIFGDRLTVSLDGGFAFFDGGLPFGKSKTIRGIVVAILTTAAAAALIGFVLATGAIVAAAVPPYPQRSRCRVISGGQLRRTGTTLDPAPTEV